MCRWCCGRHPSFKALSLLDVCRQVSRQKLTKDWRKKLQYIQTKVAEAAQSLPQELKPAQADGPSSLDYLQARSTRDALAAGTSERSLFGGLTGPASVWDKLVRAHERDSAPPLPRCGLTAVCQ